MSRRRPSLRRRLAAIGLTISTIAFVVCGALVMWITMMHRSTMTIVEAMERVRVLEEAEISLLLHTTAGNRLIRIQLASELERQIAEASRHADTEREMALLAQVEASVDTYLQAPDDESAIHLDAAYRALENLVAEKLQHARVARDRADRWNQVGDLVAVSVAVMLLVLTAGSLIWLKQRAFQPVLTLAAVMKRFGRGERDVRAGDLEYEELELMRERFNEMANALAAQHDGQIAFVSGVAHDLRGPLGALHMSLEMLRIARPAPDSRELRAFEIADRQVLRLERMIGDFLDTAKIDAGALELRWQIDDIGRIVRDVVDPLRASAPNHELVLDAPAEPLAVRCDPVRLEQVVSNLVSNAIKYSPQGGPVRIALVPADHELCLTVSDRGIGITTEDQARLFEPFQRVGDTKGAIAGVGLGLFIVRRIVEAHGGRIDLASTPGKGSTFTVCLPRASQAPA